MRVRKVGAFAPASIGNLSIGFDVLGMAIEGVGDRVFLSKRNDKKIVIQNISGSEAIKDEKIPSDFRKNTAGCALLAFQKKEKLNFGFDVEIKKGIPLGSGMGGSAASAVAAVVAAQQLIPKKISTLKLFEYALEGEKIASGAAHPDNVAPSLLGGIVLSHLDFKNPLIKLPFPRKLSWVLVHPEIKVETKTARKILKPTVSLAQYVKQSAHLASFISGLYVQDKDMLTQGFNDILIESQRAHLIPGFMDLKKEFSKDKDVVGFAISGSGPSVFALSFSKEKIKTLGEKIKKHFKRLHIDSQIYFGNSEPKGATKI